MKASKLRNHWGIWFADILVFVIILVGLESGFGIVASSDRFFDWMFYLLGFGWSLFRYLRFGGPSLLRSLRFRSMKNK